MNAFPVHSIETANANFSTLRERAVTNTRTSRAHKLKVRIPRVGVDAPENSFIVKSSRLWNNLPDKYV
jgi:hypothetical protein